MNKKKGVLLILSLLIWGVLQQDSSFANKVNRYQPQIGNFTSSSDFVIPDRIFTLSCIVNDLDGRETIQNATVELTEGVILFWENETNKFSLIRNLNNYARLEAESYSVAVNSSAYALNFRLSYHVNMPEGPVSILSPGTKVFDNSSAYGFGNYTNLFVFGSGSESWQQKPYPLQPGRAIGFEEAVVILVVFVVFLIVIWALTKREKSTQEKYHDMIDVQPKRREK